MGLLSLSFTQRVVLLVFALLFTSVITLLWLSHSHLNERLGTQIQQKLHSDKSQLVHLMHERGEALLNGVKQLAAEAPIRRLLARRGAAIDLSLYPVAGKPDFLLLVNDEGETAAFSRGSEEYVEPLRSSGLFAELLNHRTNIGSFVAAGAAFQIVAAPLQEGKRQGLLLLGRQFGWHRLDLFDNNGFLIFAGDEVAVSGSFQTYDGKIRAKLLESLRRFFTIMSQGLETNGIERFAGIRLGYLLVVGEEHLPRFVVFADAHNLRLQQNFYIQAGVFFLIFSALGLWGALRLGEYLNNMMENFRQAVEQAEREYYDTKMQIPDDGAFIPLASSFNEMLQNFREKEKLNMAMEQLVSRDVAYAALRGAVATKGGYKQASVLVANIQNFSKLSRKHDDPTELLSILNNYFSRMGYCVDARGGLLDKYLGDSLLALFGVPIAHDNDTLAAVQAALDMLEALELFNLEVATPKGFQLHMCIAVYDGTVLEGNIGAENHRRYSVIGEPVKLATRLQAYNRIYGCSVLLGETTYRRLILLKQSADLRKYCRHIADADLNDDGENEAVYEIMPRLLHKSYIEEAFKRFGKARSLLEKGQRHEALEILKQLQHEHPEDRAVEHILKYMAGTMPADIKHFPESRLDPLYRGKNAVN